MPEPKVHTQIAEYGKRRGRADCGQSIAKGVERITDRNDPWSLYTATCFNCVKHYAAPRLHWMAQALWQASHVDIDRGECLIFVAAGRIDIREHLERPLTPEQAAVIERALLFARMTIEAQETLRDEGIPLTQKYPIIHEREGYRDDAKSVCGEDGPIAGQRYISDGEPHWRATCPACFTATAERIEREARMTGDERRDAILRKHLR